MSTSHKFPKKEHLKSKREIDELFSVGKFISESPIRIIYKKSSQPTNNQLTVGISIPKRNIKLAVKRNLIKRRIKEAYRLHNTDLKNQLLKKNENITLMFLYSSKQICSYKEIESKIKVILDRLIELSEKTSW